MPVLTTLISLGRVSLSFLVLGSIAIAADKPQDSLAVRNVLTLSDSAPPELAADLKLRLVEKGLLKTRQARIQALQDAFELANRATFKLPSVSTGAGKSQWTDSDAGMLTYAAGLHDDTLSLQLRAVDQWLRLAPQTALASFKSIPGPQIPTLSCSDAMGYSLGPYYTTLGALFKGAFTPADRKKELDAEFLLTYLTRPGTYFDLEPAAHLLNELRLPNQLLARAITHYAQALAELPDDDRSFTAATTYSLVNEVFALAESGEKAGVPVSDLISGFGDYLRTRLHTTRCADTASAGMYKTMGKAIAEDFNNRFHSLGPDSKNIPLIAPEDLQPSSMSGSAAAYTYWDKPESKELMTEYKRLRFGSTEEQAADEQPTQPGNMAPYLGRTLRTRDDWLARANDFFQRLDEWDTSAEPGTAAFHEKCLMYEALLKIVPSGNLRRTVFTEYLELLRDSPVERTSPPEWLYHLQFFLKQRFEEGDQQEFTRAIAQSGDATMQAYADFMLLTSSKHSGAGATSN